MYLRCTVEYLINLVTNSHGIENVYSIPIYDPYIIDSKRLITVHRNNIRFKQLAEFGVSLVERKDGI